MGYLASPCPNKWGIFADGSTISDYLQSVSNNKKEDRSLESSFVRPCGSPCLARSS